MAAIAPNGPYKIQRTLPELFLIRLLTPPTGPLGGPGRTQACKARRPKGSSGFFEGCLGLRGAVRDLLVVAMELGTSYFANEGLSKGAGGHREPL